MKEEVKEEVTLMKSNDQQTLNVQQLLEDFYCVLKQDLNFADSGIGIEAFAKIRANIEGTI